jgi:crotonobetainyl-CoA:carnitine CoA-transferase CaiB-like acyl-CoA transferase
MSTPLEGIRVLDLTRLAPGPYCTMILGDLGAEVIKIEEPGPPSGRRAQQAGAAGTKMPGMDFSSSPHNALNRNKKSICINLKSHAGKEIYCQLVRGADVIVEEFRPGVARRLGIDYESLEPINPRLIYCAITGYGQSGPYRDFVGHDLNYIGTAGALSILGRPDSPPTIPHNLLADYAGGGLQGAVGIMAALVARGTTGRGQYVDVAMLDGTIGLLAQTFSSFFATGKAPRPGRSMLDGGVPNYNVYRTADGKSLTVAALEPWFFANLCRELGREDLIEHEFNPEKREEIRRFLEGAFASRTRDEWFERLGAKDVCVGRMLELAEVADDPQVKARNMVVELEDPDGIPVRQVGLAVKLSRTPGSIRSVAPRPGQHTEEILRAIGYDLLQIDQLRSTGAIK